MPRKQLRIDYGRELSIGGNSVTRGYGETNLCEMRAQVGVLGLLSLEVFMHSAMLASRN